MWAWPLLGAMACLLPCPPGLVRTEGHCQAPGPGVAGLGAPLTEEEFLDSYDRALCDALEECACEVRDTGDCEPELDCPETRWPGAEGCRFDGLAARDCVRGRFSCDVDGDEYAVEPPAACARVYVCDVDTGTGSAP